MLLRFIPIALYQNPGGYNQKYTPRRERPMYRPAKTNNYIYDIIISVTKMDLPQRKQIRLENFDYNQNGAYFITICVKDRKNILSKINVGTGVPDCPKIRLLNQGKIADKYINQLNDFYNNISVDKYTIMPDHIHLLISVQNGQSGTPVPTNVNLKIDNKNSIVSKFVSTLKRFCNKEYGENIWQTRYYDHVIRNQEDYNEAWEYIDNNPQKWVLTHKPQYN